MEENNQKNEDLESIDKSRSEMIGKLIEHDSSSDYTSFRKVINSCSVDLERYMFQDAFIHFISKNKQGTIKILNDSCPPALKTKIFVNLLRDALLNNDQNAFLAIYNAYPQDLQEGLLARVLLLFAQEGGQQPLKMIYESISDLRISKVGGFSAALIRCVEDSDKKALEMIIDVCSDDFKIEVLAGVLSFFAKNDNPQAIKMVNDVCSKHPLLKTDIFSAALLDCVIENNQKAVEIINDIWFYDLKKDDLKNTSKIDMLADVMLKIALLSGKVGFQMVIDAFSECFKKHMPVAPKKYSYKEQKEVEKTKEEVDNEKDIALKYFKNKLLSSVLNKVTVLENFDRAFEKLVDVCSQDSDFDIQHAQENYESIIFSLKAIDIIVENCSSNDEDLIEVFSSSLATQSALKNKEAVSILTKKSPAHIEKEIFFEALKSINFFNKKEEIEILIHDYSDDLTKHIFFKALKHYALNNFKNFYDKSFDAVVGACPDELKEYMFIHALEDSEVKANKEAFEMVENAHRLYQTKNKFLKALEDENQEAIEDIVENSRENLKEKMVVQVLRDSALKKNQKAIEMIVKNFPNIKLRMNVFNAVMKDSAIKKDDNARSMIESAYRKYSIRNKFIELLQEKDQKAVDKLLTGCWPNLKKVMFSEALQKFALEENQEVVDIILKKCPDELKEHMFTQTLENPDFKKNQEAVDMITGTETYRQYCMSKMAANPVKEEEDVVSERVKAQGNPIKPKVVGTTNKKAQGVM